MTDPRTDTTPEVDETPDDDFLVDGEYDLDAAYAEAQKPPFRFRWAGQSWVMPSAQDLDWRVVGSIGAGDGEMYVDQIRDVLREAFGEEQWALFDKTPQPGMALVRLFTRWADHSGLQLGEAQSFVDSSNGTAKPSKRTSTGTTKSGSTKRSSAARKSASRRGKS